MNPERKSRSCGRAFRAHERLGLAIRSRCGACALRRGLIEACDEVGGVGWRTSSGSPPPPPSPRSQGSSGAGSGLTCSRVVCGDRLVSRRGVTRVEGWPCVAAWRLHLEASTRLEQQGLCCRRRWKPGRSATAPRSITSSLGRGGPGPSQPDGVRRSGRSLRPSCAALRAGRCPAVAGLDPALGPRPARARDRGEGRGPPGLLPAADGDRPC